MIARSAKHAVRHILTRRQIQRSREAVKQSPRYFGGKWQRSAAEEGPDFRLQRFWAMDSVASLESLNGQVIAQEAQLIEADPASAIAPEAPIPPIPPMAPLEPTPQFAEEPVDHNKGKDRSSFRIRNADFEDEVQLMICALQLHPEALNYQATQSLPHTALERLSALRLGLLHVVSWVRLAAAAHELYVWHAPASQADSSRGKDPSRTSSVSTACSQVEGKELDGALLASLLSSLGQRLFNVGRQSATALVRAVATQLRISLPKDFLSRVRIHNSGLSSLPMRVPGKPWETGGPGPRLRCSIRQSTHTRSCLSFADAVGEALQPSMQSSLAHAMPPSASSKLAAELVNQDLSLAGRWHRGLVFRGQCSPPGQDAGFHVPEGMAPGSGPWQDMLSRSFATGSVALQRPGAAQDHFRLKQKICRCRALLKCVQTLLVADHPSKFKAGPVNGEEDMDNRGVHSDNPDAAANDADDPQQAFSYKKIVVLAGRALQTVANLLGELGGNCPPELFVALFALRGYICEREGDVDACYLHYLQALAALDDAWGDPRRPGCQGHPYALFLLWKLGLISYARKDLLSISKFGDYFRALLLFYGGDSPFSWGPAALAEEQRPLLDSERGGQEALHHSEALISRCLGAWWHRHDILDFGDEGFPPSLQMSYWQAPGKEREVQRDSNSGIAGDRQDVWRGTVFTFGFNELGQLGIGASAPSSSGPTSRDLAWSGSPVRVVSFKDLRIKDVSCGEAHCLALDMEGQLYAWGFDEFSQAGGHSSLEVDVQEVLVSSPLASPRAPRGKEEAGGGSCRMVPMPHRLPTDSISFVGIACGAQFSLALDTAGGVWSWGNGDGGVLGLGAGSLCCHTQLTRIPIYSEGTDSQECCKLVACGSYHSMAVSRAGLLYSWGRTEGGQLGLEEDQIQSHIDSLGLGDTCVCTPTAVAFPKHPETGEVKIAQAAGGDVHSLALDSEGGVWSWGWGEFGQLGLGFSSSSFQAGVGGASSRRPTPHQIPAEYLEGKVLLVACGGAFSAALVAGEMSEGGHLLMWGANDVGQCGLPAKKPIDIAVPKEVPGLRGILLRTVACGTTHAVAIDMGGQAFSWGSAHYGKLGRLDPPKQWSSAPMVEEPAEPGVIRSLARLRISKASCGLHHTLLATEVRRRRAEASEEASTGSFSSSKIDLSMSVV
ncbi:HERC2 [Symbiodinium natans]|uniref:HERC2 protein n=1 Tax=Symbiodinium natans TaxID=878477 RepID=A0A812FYH5_9DINO|nr:HERC2 [Symbiodinium natans]